jgi:radical SAM protein (TIGR01212 family)
MTPYYKFSEYLKEQFGCRVHKITVDAGFSCPNIDGTFSKNGCIFCNNYAFSPALKNKIPLEEQIQRGIEHGKNRYTAEKFIVYFQTYSNTHAPVETLKKRYDAVRQFPEVIGISIGTRPDLVDEEKLTLIETYTKDYEAWIEYGLQSIHDRTLKTINRNHTYRDFLKAVDITKNRNIKICAHVIIGLPGESEKEMMETAQECSRIDIDGIKIHPLHVVKGTALEKMFHEGKFKPLEMEKYVELAAEFMAYLNPRMVIQRLTADCPADFLVAPAWLNRKQHLLKTLEKYMLKENFFQGSHT